ncbi:MAG: hypothetical protein OQK03_08350 [Colwellia sp.]|nr:hypothetical protein [Colwellia sp.]MCW8866400.1 hypothetical protein [Colwellia sp.]
MEIQSAFNSGVQGFQKANEEANQAAANIVANTVATDEEASLETSGTEASSQNETKLPDLNQSIVDLKVAEFQAKASSEVIQSADESLGTLLDVTV